MNILVIGSGGREHALAWKLAQSSKIDRVYLAPGNGGTAREPKCENIPLPGNPASPEAQDALRDFARKEKIDLTVVGPEAPLAAGIVDTFREAGLPIIGPDQRAARLETSKGYAKSFMDQYGVRTARSRTFSEYQAALHYTVKHFKAAPAAEESPSSGPGLPPLEAPPLVIKADGLAAGKGVVAAATLDEAEAALASFMREGVLGEAGKTVVLEEFLGGREVSILAAVSVKPGQKGTILPFIPARDHKRRFEGGRGPNTGGMGAIAPVPDFSPVAEQDFTARILKPTLRGLEQEGMDYRGFIFFGLMVKDEHCFLLEYNVRLGDPETQAVLPLMESDLGDLCLSILKGDLEAAPPVWKTGAVYAPVAVAEGYPGPFRTGDPITVNREGLAKSGGRLFFAGAVSDAAGDAASGNAGSAASDAAGDRPLLTAGGRVLAAAAWGSTPEAARTKAYEALAAVSFEGMAYRRDIGTE
jgi:phosphoribosylamine--glycine ligase